MGTYPAGFQAHPVPVDDLRITGTEEARALNYAAPGDYLPADYIHVREWTASDGTRCLTLTASYVPVGYFTASHAPWQAMDAAARRYAPGARFSGAQRETQTYGAFRLGSVIRQYRIVP